MLTKFWQVPAAAAKMSLLNILQSQACVSWYWPLLSGANMSPEYFAVSSSRLESEPDSLDVGPCSLALSLSLSYSNANLSSTLLPPSLSLSMLCSYFHFHCSKFVKFQSFTFTFYCSWYWFVLSPSYSTATRAIPLSRSLLVFLTFTFLQGFWFLIWAKHSWYWFVLSLSHIQMPTRPTSYHHLASQPSLSLSLLCSHFHFHCSLVFIS